MGAVVGCDEDEVGVDDEDLEEASVDAVVPAVVVMVVLAVVVVAEVVVLLVVVEGAVDVSLVEKAVK